MVHVQMCLQWRALFTCTGTSRGEEGYRPAKMPEGLGEEEEPLLPTAQLLLTKPLLFPRPAEAALKYEG